MPTVKDNLDDIAISDRAIVITSLILKWFNWLILILYSDKLTTGELQFGFHNNVQLRVNSVVDYYNRAGRAVYACAIDLRALFRVIGERCFTSSIEAFNVYSNQKCNVRRGNVFSNTFNVQNGVRQGAVSSPVLFCIYIDKVIKLLRCSTIGCQI